MTDTTLTPSRLWKHLTSEQRQKAAHAFWEDPDATDDQRVVGLRNRLRRMEEELEQLEGLVDIRDQSRSLQSDEIVWQAFEDIAWMLGIE